MHLEVAPSWQMRDEKTEIFSIRRAQDNSFIATGNSDGTVCLRSGTTGRLSYTLTQSAEGFPCTVVRFDPLNPRALLAVSADGFITEWNTKTSQVNWTMREVPNNQLFAFDIAPNGKRFSTAGLDYKIRIYDRETRAVIQVLERKPYDSETEEGHTNRIFDIMYNGDNMLISGGWDNTLKLWDMRSGKMIRSFYGPHVCGDAISVGGNYLVAGSWRTHDQIQLYDMRTYTELKPMKWSMASDDRQCLIYSLKMHPSGDYFVAGGSGVNQARLFSTKTYSSIGSSLQFEAPIFSIDMNDETVTIGTGDGTVSNHKILNN